MKTIHCCILEHFVSHFSHKKYGQVDPERLPPSPRAAHFHALRAHLQIITWKLLDDDQLKLKPEEWGWKLTENGYAPMYCIRRSSSSRKYP